VGKPRRGRNRVRATRRLFRPFGAFFCGRPLPGAALALCPGPILFRPSWGSRRYAPQPWRFPVVCTATGPPSEEGRGRPPAAEFRRLVIDPNLDRNGTLTSARHKNPPPRAATDHPPHASKSTSPYSLRGLNTGSTFGARGKNVSRTGLRRFVEGAASRGPYKRK